MANRTSASRTQRRRNRRYLSLVVIVMVLAAGWVAFWNYATSKAEETLAGWRAREAKAGRVYACGTENFAGFPFRFEFLCDNASAVLKSAQPPVELKTRKIHVAAQIYQPTLLISEFEGPLAVAEPGRPPDLIANWKLAQSSVRGTPQAPNRVSLSFDDPTLERRNPTQQLLRAKHLELHGRIVEGSVTNRPVIEAALRAERLSAPAAGPLAVAPIDASIDVLLRGLTDFSPKDWPARFREIQAAGGRIEIVKARVSQGETLAVGSGALSLNARGALDGQINLVVAGLDAFINTAMAARRQQAGLGITLGLSLLGGTTSVEGRPAVALPLRVTDGAIFLGPLPLGQIPPLF